MSARRKFIIGVVIIATIAIVSSVVTNHNAEVKAKELQDTYLGIDKNQATDDNKKEVTSSEKEIQIRKIIGNTYEYEDEFLPGKPQTYTFIDSENLVVAYWNDTENEQIMAGMDYCTYRINDELNQIKIYYPDRERQKLMLEIKDKSIVFNNAEYTLSNRVLAIDTDYIEEE